MAEVVNTVCDAWRERLVDEYYQTKQRYEDLHKFNVRRKAEDVKNGNSVDYKTPMYILINQENVMKDYLEILELRAELEGINLYNPFPKTILAVEPKTMKDRLGKTILNEEWYKGV